MEINYKELIAGMFGALVFLLISNGIVVIYFKKLYNNTYKQSLPALGGVLDWFVALFFVLLSGAIASWAVGEIPSQFQRIWISVALGSGLFGLASSSSTLSKIWQLIRQIEIKKTSSPQTSIDAEDDMEDAERIGPADEKEYFGRERSRFVEPVISFEISNQKLSPLKGALGLLSLNSKNWIRNARK